MNIRECAPQNVCYEDLVAQAKTYQGTKEEMMGLIKSKELTIVTDKAGNITGGYINAHPENPMLDAIAGENFNRAYGWDALPYMLECLKLIAEGKDLPEPVKEESPKENDCETYTMGDTLPSQTIIDYEVLDRVGYTLDQEGVKSYLRNKYGHYLSKDAELDFRFGDTSVTVKGIEWGRKK